MAQTERSKLIDYIAEYRSAHQKLSKGTAENVYQWSASQSFTDLLKAAKYIRDKINIPIPSTPLYTEWIRNDP